jgi:pimeloyl-ACP methyl ester carboxylesterase
MKGCLRWGLIAGAILVLLFLLVPLVAPYPPVPGAVAEEQLADPDSRFMDVNGVRLHYKDAGQGEPALILLHGFGASAYSWREVIGPLAQRARVIAMDRPAFGLTSRPLRGQWAGQNPYGPDAQPELIIGLMDKLNVRRAVLVGHSAGGSVAMLTALRYPDRVPSVIFVDAAIYAGGGLPAWLRPLLATPQARWYGPLIVRYIFNTRGDSIIASAWRDTSKLTPAILAGYRRPLRARDWDRAFWEFLLAGRPLDLASRLDELTMPALVITGDHDTWVDTALSRRLAAELPHAELVEIPDCNHLPQEEQPQAFLQAVNAFLDKLR